MMIGAHWEKQVDGRRVAGASVTIAAVVTDGIDWAAYYGPGSESIQRVALSGDKLPEQIARALFPGIQEAYRN